MARANCRCCGNEYSVNADGTIRYHIAADPECQDASDENSRKCRGVGQRPREERCENCGHAGHGHADMLAPGGTQLDLKDCTECGCAQEIREMNSGDHEVAGYVCRVPAGPHGCGKAVQLTANNRARSHLNPQGEPCGGGSDWPLAVMADGSRRDTSPDPHAQEADAAIAAVESMRLENTVLGYDPQDPDGPGEEPSAEPCVYCGGALYPDLEYHIRNEHPTRPDPAEVFDPVHIFTDETGVQWQHPGRKEDCAEQTCCDHREGFHYVDDDNGRSGDFCLICGLEWSYRQELGAPDGWKCPPDLLAQMPEEVVALAALNPPCWECGDEVTPLVDRFGQDGKPEVITWGCERNCEHVRGSGHYGRRCRPQPDWEEELGRLPRGSFFRRHQSKGRLADLVYRTDTDPGEEIVSVTVVSDGAHYGRTGELTNPHEEITCTDHNGQRLRRPTRGPRPDPGTAGTSPSSPGDPKVARALEVLGYPTTPSAPAPTTPGSSPTATATDRRSGPRSTASAPKSPASSAEASTRGTPSGPTEKAAGSTRSAPMTDAFSTPKEAVKDSDKYDRYGRYKLLHPSNPRKKVAWTRATTFAKSIQDTFALSQWAQRMTLKGASLRPDIVAAAGTLEVKADKDKMNTLVEDAKKAAGDKVAANLGTAVHSYTEHRDKGQDVAIPEEHLPTVDAYTQVLKEFGLEPVPGLIEFTTAVMQFEIAGTSDRCYRVTRDITIDLNGRPVTLYAGEYVIGDVKTGADLSYGWQEIAIQLSIYAQGLNTSGVWSWESRTWSRPEDPKQPGVQIQVRTDVGVVPHLPVDRKDGTPLATLYAVDLTAGWAACVLCGQVRDWRKSSKLATPLEVADLAPEPPRRQAPAAASQPPAAPAKPEVAARPPTLQEMAQAVRNKAEASAVFQKAVAAKVPRAKLDELIDVMKRKLESHVEQGA